MKRSGLLAAIVFAAACGGASTTRETSPEPAPSTDAGRERVTATTADTVRGRRYTAADVRFMQGMIGHHAQALEMTVLVPARTGRRDFLLLSERIAVSQQDEIARMRRWLLDRGEEAPDPAAGHAHHGAGDHALMPGMLTREELARLAAASGAEFDRLFLEFMIRHHEGALTMVETLFASPGAGQDSELFQFATDVEADQRAEIDRMRRLQAGPVPGT
ncbi:MAG TPA: DUF305 domain-containing protein [Longimicrobiaceae bacterium]|nr:DUF305 domain-containing protein [Longimicrobiaceae bacterium]